MGDTPWWLEAIGATGAVIFCGRFYLQWYFSERLGRSVVPLGFWYMSAVGSLITLGYSAAITSATGTLSHTFNIFVYARNLSHIFRARGWLTPGRKRAMNLGTALVLSVAVVLLVSTWYRKYHNHPPEDAARAWFWIAVGVMGNLCFAGRFLVQWLASEWQRKSVIPVAFWYLSLGGALFITLAHAQQHEWLLAVCAGAPFPIYLRNLWLIYQGKGGAPAEE